MALGNNPSGVDTFGYSRIQKAVTKKKRKKTKKRIQKAVTFIILNKQLKYTV